MKKVLLTFVLSLFLLIIMLISTGCLHTHTYDRMNAVYPYLKSAANCNEGAVYYYSCTCGEKGTETFNDNIPLHLGGIDGNCSLCGETIFTMELSSDGTYYTVTGTDSSGFPIGNSLTIPSTYKNLPVMRIGNRALRDIPFFNLINVTISNGVTHIDERAFENCSGLTSITIPSSVESIGDFAFSGCSDLASITVEAGNPVYHSAGNCLIETSSKTLIRGCRNSVIPTDNTVASIGDSAFSGCRGLTDITIPNSVESIGDFAFQDCSSLTSITLPNSVESIGWYAFRHCNSLVDITIPNSVTQIGCHAFYDCSDLASITVEEGNPVYHSAGNCLIETSSKTLIHGCKNSVIPTDNTVTSISDFAFMHCYGLTAITIPNSVEIIGDCAFMNCYGLTDITIQNGVTRIGDSAFSSCHGLTDISIPSSVESIGYRAFNECIGLTSINFEDASTWYYADPPLPESSTAIDVTDGALNATYFKDIYCNYNWYKE